MKWKFLIFVLLATFLTAGCNLCQEEHMAETADIAVIDGEDAGTTPWEIDSITEEAGNTFSLQAAAAHNGDYGYEVAFGGSNDGCYASKSILGNPTEFYFRFYMRFPAYDATNSKYLQCYFVEDGGNPLFYARFFWVDAGNGLGPVFYINTNSGVKIIYNDLSTARYLVGTTWYRIELHYISAAQGTGGYELWEDGISLSSDFSSWATSNFQPDNIEIGPYIGNVNPVNGSKIYFDDILMSTTGPIGAYSAGGGVGLTPGYWSSHYWPASATACSYFPDEYWPDYGTGAPPVETKVLMDYLHYYFSVFMVTMSKLFRRT